MRVTKKHYSIIVFAFGFETCINPVTDQSFDRPDISSTDYRVIEECVCQKQQGMSNIIDEMWLLTE